MNKKKTWKEKELNNASNNKNCQNKIKKKVTSVLLVYIQSYLDGASFPNLSSA